jgi:hypothetical protein
MFGTGKSDCFVRFWGGQQEEAGPGEGAGIVEDLRS